MSALVINRPPPVARFRFQTERESGMRVAEIIWIDAAPLRSALTAECQAQMARLEEVRERWHHYERKDRPAFIRWRAREFGALLSRAREVEDQITEARDIVREVEAELRCRFQTPQEAYGRVRFRRANPGVTEPEPEVRSAGTKCALSEFEQETLFRDWVQRFLGTNPDKMDDAAYDSSFELFKTHMFTHVAPAPPALERRPTSTSLPEEVEEAESALSADERIKTLYRRLVRQLHPDMRADGTSDASMLWHDAQEAYAAGDVVRMELLLALSHLRADDLAQGTSLGELQLVHEELERSVSALADSVRVARQEEAWDFARKGASPELSKEIERQLKFELAKRIRHLELLQQTLREWQAPTGG